TSQTAFALAFLSPVSANALLSEKYEQQQLPKKELILANLFNSFPAYFVHTPSLIMLLWPVLGSSTLIYVGISLIAALLRTFLIFFLAQRLLPLPQALATSQTLDLQEQGPRLGEAFSKAVLRLKRRLPKLLFLTIPIYLLMFWLVRQGFFAACESWLAEHALNSSLFSPQAASIIVLHFLAELGSALGAAGSLLSTGALSAEEVVFALLIGNILSTPLRALRHQLPSYIGFFSPKLGLQLLIANQGLRAASMLLVTVIYFWMV
ncbi:MAG: hypothetical protein IJS50_04690, partial [Desulfovibrio sp.]|nr:hypothetical protein [Desulfovibrio sp.]